MTNGHASLSRIFKIATDSATSFSDFNILPLSMTCHIAIRSRFRSASDPSMQHTRHHLPSHWVGNGARIFERSSYHTSKQAFRVNRTKGRTECCPRAQVRVARSRYSITLRDCLRYACSILAQCIGHIAHTGFCAQACDGIHTDTGTWAWKAPHDMASQVFRLVLARICLSPHR